MQQDSNLKRFDCRFSYRSIKWEVNTWRIAELNNIAVRLKRCQIFLETRLAKWQTSRMKGAIWTSTHWRLYLNQALVPALRCVQSAGAENAYVVNLPAKANDKDVVFCWLWNKELKMYFKIKESYPSAKIFTRTVPSEINASMMKDKVPLRENHHCRSPLPWKHRHQFKFGSQRSTRLHVYGLFHPDKYCQYKTGVLGIFYIANHILLPILTLLSLPF